MEFAAVAAALYPIATAFVTLPPPALASVPSAAHCAAAEDSAPTATPLPSPCASSPTATPDSAASAPLPTATLYE